MKACQAWRGQRQFFHISSALVSMHRSMLYGLHTVRLITLCISTIVLSMQNDLAHNWTQYMVGASVPANISWKLSQGSLWTEGFCVLFSSRTAVVVVCLHCLP